MSIRLIRWCLSAFLGLEVPLSDGQEEDEPSIPIARCTWALICTWEGPKREYQVRWRFPVHLASVDYVERIY